MNESDVHKLIQSKNIPGSNEKSALEETHISWVILSGKFAFKIKKPISLPFLDFSDLKKRKFYCEKEIELNSRFSKEIYLKVVPVRKHDDSLSIAGNQGNIIDYAVMMKRLHARKQMDLLLNENKVKKSHITKLARKISFFHKKARVIENKFSVSTFRNLFTELSFYKKFVRENLGTAYYSIVADAEKKSKLFLDLHKNLFNERAKKGFVRDCHGDLHSKNIFLYSSPILFDCIEFNDEYRYIDILYEIAFLCMDLDFHRRFNLSESFRKEYLSYSGLSLNKEELQLFNYYKCCRANIRAKVSIIKALGVTAEKEKLNIFSELKIYLNLIKLYSRKY